MGTTTDAVLRAERDLLRPRKRRRLGAVEFTFGILLPLFCLLADPIVFAIGNYPLLERFSPDPLFPHWRAAAWAFLLVECGALLAYTLGSPRDRVWHALFGGIFLVGALTAFSIGIVIGPIAILGAIFMGIGLLGLVPFFTAGVFLRRGLRAFGRGRVWRGRVAPLAVLVGMAVGVGVPVGIWGTGKSIMRDALHTLAEGAPGAEDRAASMLDRYRFLIYPDDIVVRYQRTQDVGIQTRLASTYESLTGMDIEARIQERRGAID